MTEKVKSVFNPMKPSGPPPSPAEAPGKPVSGGNALTQPNRATEADRTPPKPVALYTVVVMVRVVNELPKGEPVMVRSKRGAAGERSIHLWLNAGHLIVSRSLKRADTLVIRFLLCMAVAEYLNFWGNRFDGRSLRDAITKLAGIEGENFWGLTLASKLAGSELLRVLDRLPIFSPVPSEENFELFRLTVQLREYSDIRNWRPKREGVANV